MILHHLNYTRAEIAALLTMSGHKPVHADSVFANIHRPSRMSKFMLPQNLRESFPLESTPYEMTHFQVSRYDQSVKFITRFCDGAQVESVIMPEKDRITLCVSSQVGCAQACSFCSTGRMGLKRNLNAGEIVAQLVAAKKWIADQPNWQNSITAKPEVTNIVFMGMGEPLDNIVELKRAYDILTDPIGLGVARRKVSVSTAGHLDGLKALWESHPDIRVALSIHNAISRERNQLMPINRRWDISEVLAYIRNHPPIQKHGILVQYTIIQNVNASKEHADRLIELLRGIKAKVNLIPLNTVENSRFEQPEAEYLDRFAAHLHNAGLRTLIRFSKGQDIAAACGQLIRKQT